MFLRVNALRNFYTVLFVICPILNCYDGPTGLIRLSLFLLFSVTILYFIGKVGKPLKLNKQVRAYLYLTYIFMFLSFVSFIYSNDVQLISIIGRTTILILSIITIYVSSQLIVRDKLVSLLKVLSILVILFTAIQVIWLYLTGDTLSGHIPWLEVHNEQTKVILYSVGDSIIYRPTSFFLEPSQIGLFLGMALSVILFLPGRGEKDQGLMYIALFLFGAIISTSATAVGLVLANLMMFLWEKQQKSGAAKMILFWFIFIVFCFFISLIYDEIYVFSRFMESNSRFTTFLTYFNELDAFQQLIGTGIGNNVHYFANTLDMDWGFVSGFGLLLLQFGYVGLTSTIITYLYLIKITSKKFRPFLVLYIVAMSFENLLYGFWMVAFLSLSFLSTAQGDEKCSPYYRS
jgi:hypothetical protein